MPAETNPDRSLLLRFRFAAGLLAILCAFDAGLELQLIWARDDHAKVQQERSKDIRAVLDDIERQRGQITELNRQAQRIIDEKTKNKAPEPVKPSD